MAGAWWDKLGSLGETCVREVTVLPQGVAKNMFKISGGRVLMTSLVGTIDTLIATAANNLKLTANVTTGTDVDIAANLDIGTAPWLVGDVLGLTGINTDPLIPPTKACSVEGMTCPVILQEGTLDWECSASETGKIQWTMGYVALDDGAIVTAVIT